MNRLQDRQLGVVMLSMSLFVGLGAFVGAAALLYDPSGILLGVESVLPYLKELPMSDILFRDFRFCALALLLVNGVPNMVCAYLILRKNRIGTIIGTLCGFALITWILLQLSLIPTNFMSVMFGLLGILQTAAGCVVLKHGRN